MEELVQARLKEGQSPPELGKWVLRKRDIVFYDGLDRVADRSLLEYFVESLAARM